jgi:hypothetical protein
LTAARKPATPSRRHPATFGAEAAWSLPGGDGLAAWRTDDGGLVLQNEECDILIAASLLRHLAEAALAVHVHNGRPDVTR